MNTEKLKSEVSDFLNECISEKILDSFFVSMCGDYFWQLRVKDAETVLVEIGGASHIPHATDLQKQNFNSLLESGWQLDHGNAVRAIEGVSGGEKVVSLVNSMTNLLISTYQISGDLEWEINSDYGC